MLALTATRCFQNIPQLYFNHIISFSRSFNEKKWNILFFGNDKFSLCSLQGVHDEYRTGNVINKLEVVTNSIPGRKNDVSKFAKENNLPLHVWPICLTKSDAFDLGIVVSFGHLIPKKIIERFPLGILNVHASLLPRWRGAAPIIHTLLNGDTKTGVTIMRIHPHHFDIGDIVSQREIQIDDDTLQPELHDRLALVGVEALIECLYDLPYCLDHAKKQDNRLVTNAGKITQALGKLKWDENTAVEIRNLSRALCGIHPLVTKFRDHFIKIQHIRLWNRNDTVEEIVYPPGSFVYDKDNNCIRVWCKGGKSVFFCSLRIIGKRIMTALEFRNGYMKKLPSSELYFSKN